MTAMVAITPLAKTLTAFLLSFLDRYQPVDDVVDLLVGQRAAVFLAPGRHVVALAQRPVRATPLDGLQDEVLAGLVADRRLRVPPEHGREVGRLGVLLQTGDGVEEVVGASCGVVPVAAGASDAPGVGGPGLVIGGQSEVLLAPHDRVLAEL